MKHSREVALVDRRLRPISALLVAALVGFGLVGLAIAPASAEPVSSENPSTPDSLGDNAPLLSVSQTEDLDPNGVTLTITGENYDASYLGLYGPLAGKPAGVYIQVGYLDDAGWRPSEGFGAVTRSNAYSVWAQGTMDTPPYFLWSENGDGTANFTWTVTIDKETLDTKARDNAFPAVFTIAAGGPVSAANELAAPISFAEEEGPVEPIDPVEPVEPVEPSTKFAQIIPTADVTGDNYGDLLAVDHAGVLWLYPGKANGGFSSGIRVGSGWGGLTISAPGDFNSDGKADILAKAANGDLFFYPGNGKGGFGKASLAGWGWGKLEIIPAGDVTGDGVADVLAIDESGNLFYYAGDGKGKFKGKLTQNGKGWRNVDLYPAGDLNRDGKADILSIRADGTLHTHLGKGNGGFSTSTQSGKGWGQYELFAGSDANGDGLADLYSRDADNRLWFYAGKVGGFRAATNVGNGW